MGTMLQGRPQASRGFTLIEMSIVLVIIGLIIGGILKGQEIIASAREKAVINQINAVRAAQNTYFDRYRSLPGDDPGAKERLDARIIDGDGNGIVGTSYSSTSTLAGASTNSGENLQYFNALIAANLLNGGEVVSGSSALTVFAVGSPLPASPISGAGLGVVYGTHGGDGTTATTTKTAHWLEIYKTPGTPAPALSPRQMANIDAQIDDGLPGSGGVRGTDVSTCNSAGVGSPYALSDNVGCIGLFEISN
jgi:prepilin-type N-terminal cleavage/methylation domain-containing protein